MVRVVMMEQVSLGEWSEMVRMWLDGMKQGVDSRGRVMHMKMSDS